MKLDEALTIAAEAHRQKNTPAYLKSWAVLLADYPEDVAANAVMQHLKQSTEFMTPAAIIALIDGNPEDRAVQQWGEVYEAVKRVGSYRTPQFDDERTTAAIHALGGWVVLCGMREADAHWRQRDFIVAYTASAALSGARPLQGRIEAEQERERATAALPGLAGAIKGMGR